MRKWLQVAILLLMLPVLTKGQGGTTTVQATVLDPNNSPYTNSQVNITFYDPGTPGKLPLLNGSTFQTSFTIYATDSFAHFSETIPDNGIIDTGSGTDTQWKFSICYSDRATCFVYQSKIDCAHNIPVTCSGGVMDLSGPIHLVAALLPLNTLLVTNNNWTGINTFNGTTIFNGLVFIHNIITIDNCDLKLLPGPVTICTEATVPRTWTIQDVTDKFVGRTTVDLLSNKTINVDLNTLDTTSNIVGHYLRNNGTKYIDVPASTVAADVGGGTIPNSGCPANQYGNAITSSLLQCAQVAYSQISGTPTIPTVPSGLPSVILTFTYCPSGCDVAGTPCLATGTSFAQCDNPITYPAAFTFSNTNYTVNCIGMEPVDADNPGTTGRVYIQQVSSTTTSVTCRTIVTGDASAQYGRIGVIAMKR